MKGLTVFGDSYDRKARLYPVLLLVIPVVAVIVLSGKLSLAQSLCAALIGCGGIFLLCQLGRDAGKTRENALFAKWGGMPSVAIFRHSDSRLDAITKARYHKKMATLVKGAKPPSVVDEQNDPHNADRTYTAWSTYLRANTRDQRKYPLLFQENVNYGYRRNVWGLRTMGIVTNGLLSVIGLGWCYWQYRTTGAFSIEVAGGEILAVLLVILWTSRFSSEWVRIPAEAYAERLVEAIDTFKTSTAAGKS